MRLRLPKIKVEVRRGPNIMTWTRFVLGADLPAQLRKGLPGSDRTRESARVWLAAFLPPRDPVVDCLYCRKGPGVAAMGLCPNCFMLLSRFFLHTGLLVMSSDDYIVRAPRWIKFLSRFGRPKMWVGSGRAYAIVPSREDEFLDVLNRILKLEGQERITRASMDWFKGTK